MSALERIWWRRREPWGARVALGPLVLAEGLFRAGAALRGALYEAGMLPAARAGVPVVSVGNLTVGGAGKTPAVMAVASRLSTGGRRVAVLSRGYGAHRADARLVSDGRGAILLPAAEGGDEPVLLARRLPSAAVLCGPRRAELARRAVEELGCDALVLDDAFQHRSLGRDLDIVVIDASNPRGNGRCLPRGPNREPLSALRRAGLVWLSRIDQADPSDPELARLRELAVRLTGRVAVESRHAPREVLDGALERAFGLGALKGRRVMLLCGLARPQSFRRTVESLGAQVAAERAYPDHHLFGEAEIDEAFTAAQRADCRALVTTEKDAVRIPDARARDERLRVVRIEAEIVAGEEALDEALAAALASTSATPTATSTPTSTSSVAAVADRRRG